MFGKRIEIFKIFGFPIRLDASWILIALWISYTLAEGYFPASYPGLATSAYWAMGLVAAVGLFLSILFHEISHALVARHYNIPISGITLFIFGGVAEMQEESPSPKVEFWVSIVGPIFSLALAGIFFGLMRLVEYYQANPTLELIFFYLTFMNGMLAAFNLVPAFPLDGGRVFRSIWWAISKDYYKATRVASFLGQGFGWALIAFGIFKMTRGQGMGGAWYILIGFFLKRASKMSLEQLKVKQTLEKLKVAQLQQTNFMTFTPEEKIWEVIARLGKNPTQTHYPVTNVGHFLGVFSIFAIQSLGESGWQFREIREFIECDSENFLIAPEQNAAVLVDKMRQLGSNVLFIVNSGQLQAVVAAQQIFRAEGS